MNYAQLNDAQTSVLAIVELAPALVASWAAAGNPKALVYRPLVSDAQPTPNAAQLVVSAGYVIEPTQVRKTWALRAKTQAEIDAADDAADAAALKASSIVAGLKAEIAGTSTLTAAQFRVQASRVLLFLVRRAIGGE